jgi:hypothetical protein
MLSAKPERATWSFGKRFSTSNVGGIMIDMEIVTPLMELASATSLPATDGGLAFPTFYNEHCVAASVPRRRPQRLALC